MKRFAMVFLTLCLLSSAALCFAAENPRVDSFSPRGVVKGIRQVTARFSAPMTTFGDPRYEAPFIIACPEKGAGRWVDVNNWAFDFQRDLPGGISCTFALQEGLKSLAGEAVSGERIFTFSSGGPAIVSSRPGDTKEIDEEQIFILTVDGEVDEASLLANVRFSVEGIAEPLGIRLVTGSERTAVLKAAGRADNNRTLTIRCRQSFPAKATVKLIWGAGIASTSGIVTSAEQIYSYTVRDEFMVSFRCERSNANAACVPLLPMRLDFSAPVPLELARKIVMKAGKKIYQPDLAQDDQEGGETAATSGTLHRISFKGPFPEKKSFVIELPKGFKDDAGRPPVNRDKFPLQVNTDSLPPIAKFAAPFGIIELSKDTALPVTLRSVEPRLKGRQFNPDAPKVTVAPPPPEKKASMVEKARGLGQKLTAMITGTPEKKVVETIKGKQRLLPVDREANIIEWLRKVRSARRVKPLLGGAGAEEIVIPKPNGEKAFEVVGIPLHKPGLHIVELESPLLGATLLGKARPMYVSSAALVTNMTAHFKKGRESSLVWVTTLDRGLPVAGAEVNIRDCQGKLHWQGKTDSDGIARVKKRLPRDLPYCKEAEGGDRDEDYYSDNNEPVLQGLSGGLFVFARKKDDLTFVHTSWDKGIESWRFNLPHDEYMEQTIAHSVFDRSLVRAGETVQMKHFIRNHTMKGFGLSNVKDLPQTVVVKHRGSGQSYESPLAWKGDNSSESKLTVPKGAELGYYDVALVKIRLDKPKRWAFNSSGEREKETFVTDSWPSGSFRVEEFRVPLMKGTVEPPREPAVNAASVAVDLYVAHLSGGGAGGAKVKLRTQVKPRSVSFADYEDYSFATGTVATGVVKEEAFDHSYDEADGDSGQEVQAQQPTYASQELTLDSSGALRAKIDALPKVNAPQTLVAELEFRDPNGEIQTVTGHVPLWSSRLLVGLKAEDRQASAAALKFTAVVVDLKGKAVSGAKVAVELFSRQHFSHRKRLVGGFYAYEHVTETKSLGPLCSGVSDAKGILECSAPSPVSGNLILQASVVDEGGNSSASQRDVWVAGGGEWWFEAGDSDRIDLLPEKKAWNPGDSATFQVRSPFREATVLVTVEREGVMDAWVEKLSGKEPLIRVPIKGIYAPNVFVSALCVRGRVGGSKATAMFDPGKPTYRLGISEIRVGRQAHELKVTVTADKESYKVRGKAMIRVKVSRADGGILPKGAEVALAAVDEGLLELMPNSSWKLLDAMMGRRGHEIHTSTAQSQVVGRRHFGLKALPAGGGGGMRSARELFDTLLAWKGRLKLDAQGEASLEIPLNDSLTSFSVVAVASAGSGLFGTGRTSIRTTQELMVLSGLPPLVRQGDRFTARFTVRNASNREMSASVSARPSWSDGTGFDPQVIKLAPGEARDVAWPAEVPTGIASATWEVRVSEANGEAYDSLKATQRVVAQAPVQVYQATVTKVDRAFDLEVSQPKGALKRLGGVNVTLRPKLTDGLGGVVHYMKNYPYACMEQQVSRAISLKDDDLWKQIIAVLPAHLDGDSLVKYFPSPLLEGSPVLTAYILSISKEAGRELPGSLVKQLESGLVAFIEGKIRRESTLRTADLSIRKLTAIEALSQRGGASGKLLASLPLEPNLWPTSAVLDWLNILKRTADIPDRDKRQKEAAQIIRARLNIQGTTMNFSTEQSDRLWWLMVSTDTNALRTLMAFMDEGSWRDDIPRLVRGALARQQHGSWETTIANAWGVVALERFSQKFEATPVSGATAGSLDGTLQAVDWGTDPKGKTLSFPWPEGADSLQLRHSGSGKPWATVMSLAAIPLKEPLASGYHIKKTLTPVEQSDKGRWSRGDIARVRLEIDAQSDMTWVAVNDPVPAGTTILGSGLGRDSAITSGGEKSSGWPVYTERSFEAYRAYYDYLPKGKLVVEYTLRFNNEGTFHLPATRVEALYAPEMFGAAPNGVLSVGE